jgi:hypothetical protein
MGAYLHPDSPASALGLRWPGVIGNVAMAWDSRRTVPWKRLTIEYLVFAAVMVAVVGITKRSQLNGQFMVTIVFVSILWIGFGAVLAKFGYQRKTLKQARAESEARAAAKAAAASARAGGGPAGAAAPRPRPAPTKRTSTGPSRPAKGRRR